MEYVQGGVEINSEGSSQGIPTKTALKNAVTTNPSSVVFYSTGLMGRQFRNLPVSQMTDPNITLTVVGPDPYNSRKWYANITFNPTTRKHTVK